MPIARALSHSLLIAALLLSPKGWASELDEINQLAEQGKTAQALQRLNGHLGKQPTDAKALFLKGVLLAESDKQDEAIKVFSELTEKYPQLPAPYNNLAVLYAYQGNYEKAKAALEAAIRTHPSYATAHENLGDIYARMASESYSRALQLDTNNSRAKSKLALIKDLLPPPGDIAAAKTPSKEAAKPSLAAVPAPAKIDTKPVPAPAKPAETSKPAAEPVPANVKPTAPEVAATPTAPTERKKSDQTQAVLNAVESWAKAWSSQNVEQYLASYAKDFKTPNGESRASWEATRKTRVGKPSRIEVNLTNVKISIENEHTARAAFQQSYEADHLSQRTRKQLVLVQQQGKWLIQQELTNR
ncbi:tetratricopeptide repeat protein [Methylobacillus flagellatus]|uniref:nuclear transport factor 2 family protein n=1 Tax=Methylobacillus flagellatus TaxID=405 RepID=UPI002853FC36|nr:tetratricopeptide repeat protein [Methylobacillus flagellatus]MDR5170538.1 tetratricopeptide repeat protein [Methylobacillus flagellatus]